MQPETRLATTLLASLLLWSPTLVALLRGNAELPDAALWYLLALVAARVAIAAFNSLLVSYHRQNAMADAERDAEALAARLATLDSERDHESVAAAAPERSDE